MAVPKRSSTVILRLPGCSGDIAPPAADQQLSDPWLLRVSPWHRVRPIVSQTIVEAGDPSTSTIPSGPSRE